MGALPDRVDPAGSESGKSAGLGLSDLFDWLRQGWKMYVASSRVSTVYVALPFILGFGLQAGLAGGGYGLVFFLFAMGFLIFAPLLAVVFYQIAAVLERGGTPGWSDIFTALRGCSGAVWAVGLVLAALYLIWITDALIIYSVFFSFDPIAFGEYFTNEQISGDAASFVFYASILGLVLSYVAFVIGVFSIPHAFSTGAGLVDSVVFSVGSVFRNFKIMMIWALLLAVVQSATFLLFMPLGLVSYPVLALANAAAYRQLGEMGNAAFVD